MSADLWGEPVAGSESSVDAWNLAWTEFMYFEGDPLVTLAAANAADSSFVLGPVFVAVYSVLGGSPFYADVVRESTTSARSRVGTELREQAFVKAMNHLVVGDFSRAAEVLDAHAAGRLDLAAVRLAHDIYLHIGDAERRLASTRAAITTWPHDAAGWSFLMGQHSFALEEVGLFEEAEGVGRTALDADPRDLWARHALAHVFESIDDTAALLALLDDSMPLWTRQESLAVHIWWHLGLRCLAAGDAGRVIDIYDRMVPEATTAFRLCDLTSLLWRLELEGHRVGDRWDLVADRWDAVVERHCCAFIDVHALMAFARRPDHVGARRWSYGLAGAWVDDGSALAASENATTFRFTVGPLAEALAAFARRDSQHAVALFDAVSRSAHRIGGSNAQREIICRTRQALGGAS